MARLLINYWCSSLPSAFLSAPTYMSTITLTYQEKVQNQCGKTTAFRKLYLLLILSDKRLISIVYLYHMLYTEKRSNATVANLFCILYTHAHQ